MVEIHKAAQIAFVFNSAPGLESKARGDVSTLVWLAVKDLFFERYCFNN